MSEKKWFYSKEVKEHFLNPKNFLSDEEVKKYNKEADGVGEVGNAKCGDIMKMWINVKDDRIVECKFQTWGCASAIASTSVLTVMVTEKKGMKIDDAVKIKPSDIMKRLGGLPAVKVHCSVLGDQALRAAIKNYFKKTKQLDRIKENKL